VFAAPDQGTRYATELWDRVLTTGTSDVVRLSGRIDDLPAAYAAAAAAVSAAVQPEGLQRTLLEAQAMGRPVIASDLGAGPEVVLAPPAVTADRSTGVRFAAGDAEALAAALAGLFSMPVAEREAMGARGRAWVRSHFDPRTREARLLALYAAVSADRPAA